MPLHPIIVSEHNVKHANQNRPEPSDQTLTGLWLLGRPILRHTKEMGVTKLLLISQ